MKEHWENLQKLTAPLLLWYDLHRRTMPWREKATPYRTWVSEIMLQQTRVSAVIPYFERFMAEVPDVEALAQLPQERLYKLWEGLGYYSRARNLQRAAQTVMAQYGGEIPQSVAQLKTLSGVGDYTAAAIASIHFGVPVPAVDGNLLRVAARVSGCTDDISLSATKKKFTAYLADAIDRDAPGKYNQAMMDLGATVCLPNGKPLCACCPARAFCAACRNHLEQILPVHAPKPPRKAEEKTVFLLVANGKIATRKRPGKGLLASLCEFPNVEGNLDEASAKIVLAQWGFEVKNLAPIGSAKHIFTHIEWQMKGYFAEVKQETGGFIWSDASAFSALPMPSAFRRFTSIAREKLEAI